ncbi:glycosyltransferase family 2 protein [Candidatus Formimonas warabiya]|uniref:Glycosyl transferase n=1 Tax=Formimonas warabiya TaxID=1761012 RepID=A0A3G1KSJ6_FORW1|nr:glycosyltransferase [Candidatus Formimonas warabiya]ATW25384.1 glycosyl transferase [Candidatus Formimonas warabiya]
MRPPFLSYVTFNRLGLTARNILRLLESTDDFELNIIDSSSKDDTWQFLQDLTDSRIKSRTRLDRNRGPVYAYNFNLAQRKPDQFFITVDSDVYIYPQDWISRFLEVFDTFSEIGMLGIPRSKPYPEILPPVVPRLRDGVYCLVLKNASISKNLDFIPRCCLMFRPEVFNYIGYWSEENGMTDAEISARITHYTPYRVGFATNIKIDQKQSIPCAECPAQKWCSLKKEPGNTCFDIWMRVYKNPLFVKKNKWKNGQFFKELKSDLRTAYCPSIHDPSSFELMEDNIYHADWSEENFQFYLDHANY